MKNHKVEIDKRRRTSSKKHGFINSPTRIIFFSYITIIVIGGLLLYLPISHQSKEEYLPFLDCLFTSASAVCVTGLAVVPTFIQWSFFGQIIILLLVQIGGLSIIALTIFLVAVAGRKIGFKNRLLLQDSLSQDGVGDIMGKVKKIIGFTFVVEAIGSIVLGVYFFISYKFDFFKAVYYGIFHSISAFCNSGFDILGATSLESHSSDVFLNLIIIVLVASGGIGFLVLEDVTKKIRNKRHRMSVTTRLAIYTSGVLIVLAGLYFFISEYSNPNTLGTFTLPHKIMASFFHSLTLRTAGFSTINQYGLKESSKLISSFFMLVGGSPGGMAGGIKTVTIAVIFNSIWSIVIGREGIIIMNRSISLKTLQKALAVAGIMTILLFVTTFMLSISEVNSAFKHSFIDLMYECSSALGTTGLSTGITPFLSSFGKITITLSMLVGRIGPITVIHAMAQPKSEGSIRLPEAEVLIG